MFPALYHAHHARRRADLAYWLELAGRCPGRWLELGAGTGRVTRPLAAAGQVVVGLERDPAMLAYLRASGDLPPALRLLRADLTALPLTGPFAAVLIPCNTWTTLRDEERRRALLGIRRVLAPGGIFAAAMPNPSAVRSLPLRRALQLEDEFPHPYRGAPVRVLGGWERQARRRGPSRPAAETITLHWEYQTAGGDPDAGVETVAAAVTHYLHAPQVLLAELESVGLRPRALYGDYDRRPYTSDSDLLIWEAGAF
jgi:SAM-dependent methyltransferase